MADKDDLTVKVENELVNIRVGAIIRKGNKLLMVRSTKFDYYYSVGGRIKVGESSEDAVIREVYEETGVHMDISHLAYVHENFFINDSERYLGMQTYEISFCYVMNVPADFEPVCDSLTEDGAKEYLEWIDVDTPLKVYPDFFRDELITPTKAVKHVITRDVDGVKRLKDMKVSTWDKAAQNITVATKG